MQFNDKFGMRDLFMNKELKGIFPQFSKKDKLQNVYSFEWIERKIADYLKSAFNGRKSGDSIVIQGKFKDKLKEIKALRSILESMFNNMPAMTKNIRKNTKLITPFQSVDQLKNLTDERKKIMAMGIVLDNLNYNPEFKSQNRIASSIMPNDFYKRQQIWMNSVGYDKIRRNK